MPMTACTGVHKSKRVGGLDTRPQLVFLTDMFAWLRLAVGLEREHTLDSSMFVTNGTGKDWFGGASTAVFCIGGSLKANCCTTGGVEGGKAD